MKKCSKCGAANLTRTRGIERLKVDGTTFKKEIQVILCEECKDTYVDAKTMSDFYRDVTRELVRMKITGPQGIRHLRKSMGMNRGDLAELLDVTPETISRWEKGTRPRSRPAVLVLQIMAWEHLEGSRKMMDLLRAKRRAGKVPAEIRLDLHL